MTIKKLMIILLAFGGIGFGGWFAWNSEPVQGWWADQQKGNLPPAEQLAVSIAAPAINAVADRYGQEAVESVLPLPIEKNLAVPFTSQAPHANWDEDHNEFCEEASALMVGRFFQGRSIANADDAEAALQEIKQWQIENIGYYFDTTAEETARILREFYELSVEVKIDPTVDDIKRALSSNKLVIAPFAGREIGNPYYTQPGPIYHMMVFRGYTDDGRFIMNDPGTRRGAEYVYEAEVLINAMHDWVPAEPRTVPANGTPTGGKVILIVGA